MQPSSAAPGQRAPRLRPGLRPAGLLAVLVALGLAGCGDAASATPEPATTPIPGTVGTVVPEPPDDPTTAAEVREAGTRLAVGDLSLVVDPGVTSLDLQDGSDAGPDGSTTYRFGLTADADGAPAGGPVPLARLAAPEGASFEVHPDRSVVLLDADGTAVAGIAPPTVGGSAAASWRPTLEPVGRDLLVLGLEGSSTVTTTSVVETTWWATATTLLGAEWGEREGGRSLAVEPTAWARAGHDAAVALTWAQLVSAEPEAESDAVHDQLVCHTIGAPDKATWNLEPWRPDVGLLSVLAAACNPT